MTTKTEGLLSNTLSETVDRVHQAAFEGRTLPKSQRLAAARFLASLQGLPRAYAQMFALSEAEQRAGIKVFTGERMTSASARHIAGEETCVALRELGVDAKDARGALARAEQGMLAALQRGHDAPGKPSGSFCCGRCTPALWRNLAAGGLDQQEARLAAGMRYLRTHREGDGEWRRFPFAYTIFALTAIDDPGAVRELRYAAPSLERRVKRAPGDDPYAQRRHAVFTRALERI